MAGIADILYVRFCVPDLGRQQQFLDDFGFVTSRDNGYLLARGTDADRYVYAAEEGEAAFLGLGFEAESEAHLERIAGIDGAHLEALDLPGGGRIARLTDPDGLPVDVVHGINKPESLPPPSREPLNFGDDRKRLGERVSFDSPSVAVKRLGHCVLSVSDFRTSEAWYKERFGLITSDEVCAGEDGELVVGAFMRCNRGERFVDHHSLFLINGGKLEFNHAAFEVADWDSLMRGHDILGKGGYQHSWGIGKHILGSQVFD